MYLLFYAPMLRRYAVNVKGYTVAGLIKFPC